MKKGLCIFILTVTAGLCSILLVFRAVDSGKGNIAVTETVLAGDVEAAEGILVEIGTHWEKHLLWDTEYQPGCVQEAASSFDFSSQEIKWDYSNPRAWSSSFTSSGEVGSYRNRSTAYVDMDVISTDFGTALGVNAATGNITYGDIDIEHLPWPRLLQAAADQTAAGETRTVNLRLRDYYDYYPLTFSVVDGDRRIYYESFWNDYATEYFKFLIPEDEKFQVTIRKNQEGGILELKCSSTGDGYYPVEISAAGDTGYYFTFYLDGRNKDFEEIQREFGGRYAVYWLPLAQEGKTFRADIEQMQAAAQLPEGAIPVTMQLGREGQILYLLVLQKERYLLLAYSAEDGELALIQQLTAYDAALDTKADTDTDLTAESGMDRLYFRKMTVQEDGILLTWQDNRFAFIARDGEEYRFWCTGVFPKSVKGEEAKEDEEVKAWLAHGSGYLASESTFPYEHAFAFDGSRLALAAFERWDSLDSRLQVYREGQLVYSGYYQYSGELDIALGMDDRILPWGDTLGGIRRDGPLFSVLKPLRVSIAP